MKFLPPPINQSSQSSSSSSASSSSLSLSEWMALDLSNRARDRAPAIPAIPSSLGGALPLFGALSTDLRATPARIWPSKSLRESATGLAGRGLSSMDY